MGSRLLVVEDQELVRCALRMMIESICEGVEVVGEASDGRQAVRIVTELHPDIIMMNPVLPGLNGIDATRQILRIAPATRIVMLSDRFDVKLVESSLAAGASAYIVKQAASKELVAAITAAREGRTYLCTHVAGSVVNSYINHSTDATEKPRSKVTAREREVLQLLAEGNSSKQIANKLSIGLKTVETHRGQVMRKLQIRSVAELTKFAIREGITVL